jgi:hypothetical protein
MPQVDARHAAEDAANKAGLRRTAVLIVLVEIVTIVALYVFSRHFAQP